MGKYIRFDYAAKRLLRQKANFVVLEGFLSVLLKTEVKIHRMLESEGNQEHENDKFNRVDMLAELGGGELAIVEVQNNRELDYFHRVLYGTSKAVVEYINLGEDYSNVKKVYSVSIVYFGLGQGRDYAYHGKTEFRGINDAGDVLRLSESQQRQFRYEYAGDLYPEYFLLRVDDFNTAAKSSLDEWISFLKTGDIPESATAPGLPEARERLREDGMSAEERRRYRSIVESQVYERSVISTGYKDGYSDGKKDGKKEGAAEGRAEGMAEGRAEGMAEGRAEGMAEGRAEGMAEGRAEGKKEEKINIAKQMRAKGYDIAAIMEMTGLSEEEIESNRLRMG